MFTNNPILQQLAQGTASQQPNNLGQLKAMMNTIKGAQNPMNMIDSLAQNNPVMKNVSDAIKSANGNPKDAFYQMAKQKGVDPNQILNMMKGM